MHNRLDDIQYNYGSIYKRVVANVPHIWNKKRKIKPHIFCSHILH